MISWVLVASGKGAFFVASFFFGIPKAKRIHVIDPLKEKPVIHMSLTPVLFNTLVGKKTWRTASDSPGLARPRLQGQRKSSSRLQLSWCGDSKAW